MNCIDCSYSLIKDGHSKCTYEEGECIKISLLEKENAELKEDLRNKKLAIQNRNGRIKELEEANKANEWHYMKDVNCYEDLHFPPEEEKGRVLIWKVQVITENGVKLPVCYHCGSYGDLWYEINAYRVIAWKEIALPKEVKNA